MHGKVAAGKLTDIEFDDEGKRIVVAANIVDDGEWQKVMEGIYTGFSQGGRYVKRWKDKGTGLVRFTAEPSEISLVDLPCLPQATFEVIKADGSTEVRKFQSSVRESAEADELAKRFAAGRDAVNAQCAEVDALLVALHDKVEKIHQSLFPPADRISKCGTRADADGPMPPRASLLAVAKEADALGANGSARLPSVDDALAALNQCPKRGRLL